MLRKFFARTLARSLAPAVMILAGAASPNAAAANEYCVVCEGPSATYRCIVSGPPVQTGALNERLGCIKDIARGGGHQSCAVSNTVMSSCTGRDWLMTRKDEDILDGAAVVSPPPVAPSAAEAVNPEADPAKPTPTVKELIEKSATASKEALNNAGQAVGKAATGAEQAVEGAAKGAGEAISKSGSAIGNAAKKTWHCLKSLFSDC